MNITIGFSPCPNDTFIFDALVNGKIDTGEINFIPVIEDVQTLNSLALNNELDVTKISYGVLPFLSGNYDVLTAGSALGKGVGPLLISADKADAKIEDQIIAVPGENTTANFLFSFNYPKAIHKIFMRYDEIESFVLEKKGLGVIIHENRFTYADKGLFKIADLGNLWEQNTGLPIPLGGIIMKKQFSNTLKRKINFLIAKSLEYSYGQKYLSDFIKVNAREMQEDVMQKHIDLYVNNFTKNLGEDGKNAVLEFCKIYSDMSGKTFNEIKFIED